MSSFRVDRPGGSVNRILSALCTLVYPSARGLDFLELLSGIGMERLRARKRHCIISKQAFSIPFSKARITLLKVPNPCASIVCVS